MAESMTGLIKHIAKTSSGGITACNVVKTSPLQLQFTGDSSTVVTAEFLVIPAHVSLKKGDTAYVTEYGDNSYFVLGKG
jgi:hypothetical protein